MKVPQFDLTRQYSDIKNEIGAQIDRILSSGKVILGENVAEIEKEVANYVGVKFAVGVASGSDALLIGLRALGVEPMWNMYFRKIHSELDSESSDFIDKGREDWIPAKIEMTKSAQAENEIEKYGNDVFVITTPYTFFATASCIVRNGAIPVFIDVDPYSYNIDLGKVEEWLDKNSKSLHPHTVKAIIPVHLFGRSIDLKKLKEITTKYNLKILEDCAQSIGSESMVNGDIMKTGAAGDIGIFSFFPTKNLGAYGDGGMIVTNDEALYTRCKNLRVHGAGKKYYHDEIGYNSRLDELQAAILRIKLKYLDKWTNKRIELAKIYDKLFTDNGLSEFIIWPKVPNNGLKEHIYHQYVIELKDESKRDPLINFLKEVGIGTSIYYPLPLHLQKCFSYLGYKEGSMPVSEHLAKSTVAIPMFPELTENEVEYVVGKIKEYFKR